MGNRNFTYFFEEAGGLPRRPALPASGACYPEPYIDAVGEWKKRKALLLVRRLPLSAVSPIRLSQQSSRTGHIQKNLRGPEPLFSARLIPAPENGPSFLFSFSAAILLADLEYANRKKELVASVRQLMKEYGISSRDKRQCRLL